MRPLAVILASVAIVVCLLPDAKASTRSPAQLHRDFLCIHHFEGSWTAHTGNGYYGGFQMDSTFERHYGQEFLRAWGHASNWPASVQIAVAMKAYLMGRGFYPWPNTAKRCGLLP